MSNLFAYLDGTVAAEDEAKATLPGLPELAELPAGGGCAGRGLARARGEPAPASRGFASRT